MKAPGNLEIVLFTRLLIGGQRIATKVVLLGVQDTDKVHEPGQNAHRIGAATKPQKIDFVAIAIVFYDEPVGFQHVLIQPIAGQKAKHPLGTGLEGRPRATIADRADAGIVIDDLTFVLLQDTKELQDVGLMFLDLVAGAVATDHN